MAINSVLPRVEQLTEREAFASDMATALQSRPDGSYFPGYPPAADRLFIDPGELRYSADGKLILPADPAAPYTLFNYAMPQKLRPAAAFHDNGGQLPEDEAARIRWDNMKQDARGFPVHRFAQDMLTNPDIGAIVGSGYFWHPGKVKTADLGALALGVPALTTNEYGMRPIHEELSRQTTLGNYLCVLLVQREDTGQFALPGGMVAPGELAILAAARELGEETRMDIHPFQLESRGSRIVADPRLTTCTEISTELFTADLGHVPQQQPVGQEETLGSNWYIADNDLLAPEYRHRFFGSHWRMLLEIVAWYQQEHDATVTNVGLVVHK